MFSRRSIIRLILPLMGEQFLAVTIGFADTIMVSGVGEAAVSGVSIVDAINILMIEIFSALATGGSVVVSQYIGSNNRKDACTAAKQLLYAITLLSAAIMAVCLIFRLPILHLVYGDLDPAVMRNAEAYFRFTALSYPFLAVYNAGAALFRTMGNSKISMFVSFLDNIAHIGGDAAFIYGFRMGAQGAGVATFLARILAAVIMLVLICRKSNYVYIDHPFRPILEFGMVRRILNIGVPSGVENGMFQIGKLIVQRTVTTFGTSIIAANAVAGSISSFSNIPGNAVSLALITVVGQCLGAKDSKQAVFYTHKLMRMAYISMGLLNIVQYAAAVSIVGLYHLDASASLCAVRILHVFSVFSATIWIPSFVLPNALRAAGDVRFTMMTSMISMWVFRIAFCFILTGPLHQGVYGVWNAMYIDWAVRMIVFGIRFHSGKWKSKKVI